MKYAFRFFTESSCKDLADEIIIKYFTKSVELIDFAKNLNEKQRLVVNITELKNKEDSLNIFKGAVAAHPNFALLTSIEDKNIIDYSEENIKFFFVEGAGTIDELLGQIRSGVSDIYIINELGFSLGKVAPMCHDKGIQIRVYPNVAQSSSKFPIDTVKKFFIRPEDLDAYEKYVDVYEFFGPLEKQDVLYSIYKDEKWLGDLNLLILGLEEHLPSYAVLPSFGQFRSECGKRCGYNPNSCNICGILANVSKELEEKNIGIRKTEDF